MLMFLEICLTVIAWKRGWKGWALLPLAITLATGFVAGAIAYFVNGPEEPPLAIEILSDLALIIALVVMIARPRRKAKPAETVVGLSVNTGVGVPSDGRESQKL